MPLYIVTVEITRHQTFRFHDAGVRPENMLGAIGLDDPATFAVLSSRLRVYFALSAGGTR